jgi:two-component system sensor histidine kinase MprB
VTRRLTLRRRLALACAVVAAVVVVAGSGIAYALVRESLRQEVDESLRTAAAQAALLPPPQSGDRLFADAPLEGPGIVFRRLPAPSPEPTSVALPGPLVAAALADRRIDGVHARVLDATYAGGATAQLARPLTEVDAVLSRLRAGLAILVVGGIAAAALLGRLVARASLVPVSVLTGTAEHVAATRDLSRRIRAGDGEDELSRLAAAFNTMLAALERSQQAQRRLVADASHELRTPLTSLRTNLEVLADPRGGLDDADRERLRADVVSQVEELTELVGDLVDLARDDEPAADDREDVRLDAVVLAAVERARRHAPRVDFAVDVEPCLVWGSPARLHRAIANLLDNAAKFAGATGPVEVRLRAGGELTVRDHGPGIADADLPHVFDRFWRAETARGRPGSGLGLAIVRQAAEAHGGTVRAEAAPGGGALLRLRLPAAAGALSSDS